MHTLRTTDGRTLQITNLAHLETINILSMNQVQGNKGKVFTLPEKAWRTENKKDAERIASLIKTQIPNAEVIEVKESWSKNAWRHAVEKWASKFPPPEKKKKMRVNQSRLFNPIQVPKIVFKKLRKPARNSAAA